MKRRSAVRFALAVLLLAVTGAAAARDYAPADPGRRDAALRVERAPARGPTSTTLSGTLPQGKPMPRPGPYYTLPTPGARTDIHDFSGRRYGTLEAQPGDRLPLGRSPDDRRWYETDRDGVLRDRDGRRVEVLKPLPDGDW